MANVVKKAVSVPADLLYRSKDRKTKTYQASEHALSNSPSVESLDVESGKFQTSLQAQHSLLGVGCGSLNVVSPVSRASSRPATCHCSRSQLLPPASLPSSAVMVVIYPHSSANILVPAGARLDNLCLSEVIA
jgi:hypothetical protein